MTNLVDFDRALAEFLEDGPNTAPEAPVIAALAHARTTPRRPDLLGRLRPDVMAGGAWRPLGLRPALALGLVALLAAGIGITVLGSRPSDHPIVVGPSPSTAVATPAPTAVPSPLVLPSAPPATFSRDVTMLVTAGDPFPIHVSDTTGALVDATSVQPGDGASVGPTDISVVNDPKDSAAFIVTWQGTPCETAAALTVDETSKLISIAHQQCQGDALPLDRIIRLQFRSATAEGEWSSTFVEFTQPSAAPSTTAGGDFTPIGSPAAPPLRVTLVDTAGNQTTVDVVDESGLLTGAAAGRATDDAPRLNVDVSNDTATALRLHWLGSPCDTVHRLTIGPTAKNLTLDLPNCNGDSIPVGRTMLLTFSVPVSSTGITTATYRGRGGVDMPTWTATAPDSRGNRYDLTAADPSYIVNTVEGFFDPGSVPADAAGPTGIRLMAADPNTFRLIWLGKACAMSPELQIGADGSAWTLVDELCTTSDPDVLRMIDVRLNVPLTTATVPSIMKGTTVAP